MKGILKVFLITPRFPRTAVESRVVRLAAKTGSYEVLETFGASFVSIDAKKSTYFSSSRQVTDNT